MILTIHCAMVTFITEILGQTYLTSLAVIVHDIILASGEDLAPAVAARRASLFALDALEGDATFITRSCDCRTAGRKKQKKADLEDIMRDFEDGPSANDKVSGSAPPGTPESEFEEGMIFEN